jgi:hypothetical protein
MHVPRTGLCADETLCREFDPSIRGRTDQFAYRFRKPAVVNPV